MHSTVGPGQTPEKCRGPDSSTATAYSLSQQLVTSAVNVLFALVLVIAVFGWTGGKQLVEGSYSDAKKKVRKKKDEQDPDDASGGDGGVATAGA